MTREELVEEVLQYRTELMPKLLSAVGGLAVAGLRTSGAAQKQYCLEVILQVAGFDIDKIRERFSVTRGVMPDMEGCNETD